MAPRVYIIDDLRPEAVELAKQHFEVIQQGDTGFEKWETEAEYIIMRGTQLRADQIESAPLKAIAKQGVGVDNIDINACHAKGVVVMNTPGVNAKSVAEVAVMLTLAVARELVDITMKVRAEGRLFTMFDCKGMQVTGCTVGVIGMGSIGKQTANIFQKGMDCKIYTYDPFVSQDEWKDDIIHTRLDKLDDLLSLCDVVSIHCPLSDSSKNMINLEKMRKMKPSAILINVSRGGIINEDDLYIALKERVIFGAGLDVLEDEPPRKEVHSHLWTLPNIITTPHCGSGTEIAQEAAATMAVQNIIDFVEKGIQTNAIIRKS